MADLKRYTVENMSRTASLTLRIIYAACLLGATCNHVLWLWQHGAFWNFGFRDASLFSRIFWTSLTFLDPLAALLLFLRPRVGLVLTVAIIASDVLNNSVVVDSLLNPKYLLQVAFLLFVSLTVLVAWRGVCLKPKHNVTQTL